MEKKEILTTEELKKEIKNKKEDSDKISYIKNFLEDEDYNKVKKDLQKELVQLITKKPEATYTLIYDSLSEGLEPIYFWILDLMNDSSPSGFGLEVRKGPEDFEASVTSGYFGEIGQRASLMQQKAMEYLGVINNIIKSILNIIYDLKEFEIRLKPYDDLKNENLSKEEKQNALYALKGVWMDQVDSRKGRGSINLLVQDLQFVTLRDAFFVANTAEEADNLDLNARVKNILKRKLAEFNAWKDFSEKEIRKRYEIEKIYLKSQVGTLKLYANWLKPYLIAAQRLKMRSTSEKSITNPNIVNSFSNMEIEIKLYGKKYIEPKEIHESYKDIELAKKYYIVVEVVMKFRSVPSALSGQGGRHYVHGGRVDMTFNAFAFDNIDLEAVESVELYEDLELIDNYVGSSLKQLQEEIDHYLKEPVKEESKKKKTKSSIENPFKGLFEGFKEIYTPIKESILPKGKGSSIAYEELEKITKDKAKDTAYRIYSLYKLTHGMIAV